MKRIVALGIACTVAVVLFTGCSWFQTQEDKPAMELAREGMDAMKEGRYQQAIESFEKLKDWYPFNKFAILAELKVADAYYRLHKYDDAVFAYENFENLHPRNEAIPYVIYQIGRCYFEQIDSIDRDQITARKALDTFRRLTEQYPGNPYASQIEDHMKRCLKSLAGHELYVGSYYYRTEHYKAALNRFNTVISDYPDVGVHREAILNLLRCEAALNNQEPPEQP
jgi:outer membrane protein assembly factor BamD